MSILAAENELCDSAGNRSGLITLRMTARTWSVLITTEMPSRSATSWLMVDLPDARGSTDGDDQGLAAGAHPTADPHAALDVGQAVGEQDVADPGEHLVAADGGLGRRSVGGRGVRRPR